MTPMPRRRRLLKSAALIGALPLLRLARAQTPLRIALPSPGTAGSVWRPMLERLRVADLPALQWTVSDPGKMQVQLIAGSLDVGFFGPIGLAALRARGNDILLFGPGTHNHSVWLVKADSPYQRPADLIGHKIATQPETAETYQQARTAASLAGLDLKRDFQVLHGSPLANVALFERGDVDAVIVLEPTATRLVAQGARQIGRVGDMWRQASGDASDPFLVGLAAQRSWLDANRQTATRLARAFAQANAAITRQPDVLREIHAEIGIKAQEKAALDLVAGRMRDTYSSRWDPDVWRGMDRQIAAAVSVGILDQQARTSPVYDGVALS
ncbi:PhnD/SsuA/transferrin family substrate-binding protein [Bordetella genomosp. 12]|uniref:SsuA/THI5-like domain-containing protein n=1 Tax=Bordetella genomosp. 12 TaxID=463035 RepID=A0A261VDX0_9BORD|nr:PhnD/SsuA/transferrin family substrate-binding protein [Bordetella genomosp. 12]OZI71780.1 hypothetical protein CAL22_18470 [Bordetella genomosp. 12]